MNIERVMKFIVNFIMNFILDLVKGLYELLIKGRNVIVWVIFLVFVYYLVIFFFLVGNMVVIRVVKRIGRIL